MFVCLEVDTEDVDIWDQIDTALAQKFGCVHILWGAGEDPDKTVTPCHLPGNLFYVATTEKEATLSKRILPAVQHIWSGGYRLICIGTTWHQSEKPYAERSQPVASPQPVDIEVSREA